MVSLDVDKNKGKRFLTKSLILERIPEMDVYKRYLGEFNVGKKMNSPFRKDKNPSFAIFEPKIYPGRLFFKDLGNGKTGDAIMFVKELNDYNSYYQALSRIAIDFGLSDEFICSDVKPKHKVVVKNGPKGQNRYQPITANSENKTTKVNSKVKIQIRSRRWKSHDKRFWKQFGVDINMLNNMEFSLYFKFL